MAQLGHTVTRKSARPWLLTLLLMVQFLVGELVPFSAMARPSVPTRATMPTSRSKQSRNPAGAEPIEPGAESPPITAASKLAKGKPLTRTDFYQLIKGELDRSIAKVKQVITTKVVDNTNASAQAQDPWTFTLGSRYRDYSMANSYQESTASTALKYQDQRGLSLQLYGDYYEPSRWGAFSSRTSPFNYGVIVSQELFSGWSRSKFINDQKAVAEEGEAQVQRASGDFLDASLRMIDAVNILFSAHCRMKDLTNLERVSARSVSVSEVQKSARTISVRDQLRIVEAHLNVQRQVLATQFEIDRQRAALLSIDEGLDRKARILESQEPDCENEVESLLRLSVPPPSEVGDILKTHPRVLDYEHQKRANRLRVSSYEIQRRPTLSLESGFGRIQANSPSDPYNDTYVGLSFTYQFREDSFATSIDGFRLQYKQLLVGEKQTELQIESFLRQSYANYDYLRSQVPIVKASLSNTSQILKIIQTQMSIGEIEATALESAYGTYMNSVSSARDLWSQMFTIWQKLHEIHKTSKGSK